MKRLTRAIFTGFFLLILSLSPLSAQEDTFSQFPKALGVQAGFLSGFGLSYQSWGEKVGHQVAAGMMADPSMTWGADPLVYNLGYEMQYPMYTDSFDTWLAGRLYLFTGIRHRGYIEAVYDSGSSTYANSAFTLEFSLGGGIGVEAVLFDHFAAVAEMANAVIWKSGDTALSDRVSVDLQPQLSLRYRF